MLCAGTASALRKLAAKHFPQDTADTKSEHVRLVGLGGVAVVAWVALPGAEEHLMTFDLGSMPLLVINAFSTAAAMLMGGSILFPITLNSGNEFPKVADVSLQGVRDALTPLFLAGFAGFGFQSLITTLVCKLVPILVLRSRYGGRWI